MGGNFSFRVGLNSGGAPVIYPDYFADFVSTPDTGISDTPVAVMSRAIPDVDLAPNTRYMVLWYAQVTPATSTGYPRVECQLSGFRYGSSTIMRTGTTPNDINSHSGIVIFATGSTPMSTTVSIVADCVSNGTMDVGDKSLFVLKLTADDFVADSGFDISNITTSTTLQTALTLNYTPPSTGNYLIFYSFESIQTISVAQYWQVTDGTSSVGEYLIGNNNASGNDRVGVSGSIYKTGVSGAQSVTIKHRTGNATYSSDLRSCRLVAINLARFTNVYNATQVASTGGTDITYQDTTSLTATLTNTPHLWFAHSPMLTNAAALSGYHQLLKDGVSEVEYIREPSAAGARASSIAAHRVETFAAGSHTLKWQRKSETTGITTSTGAGASITLLNLSGLLAG